MAGDPWTHDLAERAEEHLHALLDRIEHPTLKAAAMLYPGAGGKRVRPRLLFTLNTALDGGGDDRALVAGAALEAIHTFTLIHDDVMDKDRLRRGRPTVHIAYDEATAINTGDAIFAAAFEAVARAVHDHAQGPAVIESLGRAVRRVAEGQQDDIHPRPSRGPVADYEQMVRLKTGALFRAAGEVAAILAGKDQATITVVADATEEAGVAFQIVDDLLDLVPSAQTGKDSLSDLRKGKETLPVILARQALQGETLEAFNRDLKAETKDQAALEALRDTLAGCGAISGAKDRASAHLGQAREALAAQGIWDGAVGDLLQGFVDRGS